MGKGSSRHIAWVLLVVMLAAVSGSAGWAAPVPSQPSCGAAAELDAAAVAAEREVVKAALLGFGLSDEQAASRVALLTDQEVRSLASDLEAVRVAGQDMRWDTTTVLLLLILVAILAS